uniref:Uncharacterized protein n=1 Tax=Arundo donax TaxID=35708 RepID=A0A0A8Y3Q9_ARUDO
MDSSYSSFSFSSSFLDLLVFLKFRKHQTKPIEQTMPLTLVAKLMTNTLFIF